MNKQYLVPIAFLLLGYFASADNNLNSIDNLNTDDFKINFSKGDNSILGIDIKYDYYFNRKLHSEIAYINKQSASVEDFREGKNGINIKEEDISFSLLYDFPLLTFGIEYEHFTNNTEESGYYKRGNTYLPYDHLIDIKGDKINIVGESNYEAQLFYSSFKVKIAPKTNLDIQQNTKIFPNHVEGGELSSDTTLDLSYQLEGQLMGNFGKYFEIGVEGNYQFTPYEYQIKKKVGDSYIEKIQIYDEKIKEYYGKVCVKDIKIIGDFYFVFKYGKREVDRTGMNGLTENIFTFGIDGKCTEL
jgi:hypothetical protein